MKLFYDIKSSIAPLSWYASVNKGICRVICGKEVEINDSFFVEGAWNGKYSEAGFINADWFCGTGGKTTDKGITFSTPTHVTSGLYSTYSNKEFCVSNSLYLLLAINDYSLDPQYVNYEVDFNSILDGIDGYKKTIHVVGGEVKVYYFKNIIVSDEGKVSVLTKSSISPFASFENYYKRLCNSIKDLANNGSDEQRHKKYGMVTTVSKGYDAPCCAVVAKQAGCDIAVTFRAEGKYRDDSGVEIAKALGYAKVIERNALDYLQRSDNVEAEYLCTGELGAQISFSAFDNDFTGNMVFTGDRGDSIWNKYNRICNDQFRFVDILNHLGCSERKLWVGYISIPMPLYGASSWSSIQKISQSDEMKQWSLDNNYDRPIPRRICETAGLRRDMFGIEKHGAGFTYRYDWMKRIEGRMSRYSSRSFQAYVSEHSQYDIADIISFYWKTKAIYLKKIGIRIKLPDQDELRSIANPTVVRYLIPWAGSCVINRYKNGLGA